MYSSAQASGELLYYDFGSIFSPRGHGRARSKGKSDPRLAINFPKPRFDEHGKISNLENIVHHFESMREDMQGFGELYFSVAEDINFDQAKNYADNIVLQGSTPYGAVARDSKPASIPEESQYLGGVGEGAWYAFRAIGNQQLIVSRYTPTGQWEYSVVGVADPALDPEQPFQITYDSSSPCDNTSHPAPCETQHQTREETFKQRTSHSGEPQNKFA
ncbi:hypothetical protein FQR65_LT16913 [Abscondita terminalis]|nr:hypothetical protein FQR65_LT16913 [Abscondita terminalis]